MSDLGQEGRPKGRAARKPGAAALNQGSGGRSAVGNLPSTNGKVLPMTKVLCLHNQAPGRNFKLVPYMRRLSYLVTKAPSDAITSLSKTKCIVAS